MAQLVRERLVFELFSSFFVKLCTSLIILNEKVKILLLDNYDSFTFNLAHYLEPLCESAVVKRNNEIHLHEIDAYDKIVLSPGPGLPKDAGIMSELIAVYSGKKPILGVCLGMQAIAECFGGDLYNQKIVKHGVVASIQTFHNNVLFQNLPSQINVGLYHSWAVTNLPSDFKVTAISSEDVIMSIEHKELPLYGVQFHPESILTEFGREMLLNFLKFG